MMVRSDVSVTFTFLLILLNLNQNGGPVEAYTSSVCHPGCYQNTLPLYPGACGAANCYSPAGGLTYHSCGSYCFSLGQTMWSADDGWCCRCFSSVNAPWTNYQLPITGCAGTQCTGDASEMVCGAPCTALIECLYYCPNLTLANGALVNVDVYQTANGTYSVGSIVSATCNVGYSLIGTSPITCSAGNTWSTTPSCQQNQCPSTLFNTTSGTPAPGPYLSLTSYNYTCAANSTAWPADSLVTTFYCNATGSWSPNLAIFGCTATCPILTLPNGTVTVAGNTSTSLGGQPLAGSVANFACNAGQNMTSGATTSTCGANGVWSAAIPVCQPLPCTNVFDATGSTGGASTFIAGSTYTFTCNANYVVATSDSTTTQYACTNAGTWARNFVLCTATCSIPPNDPHGTQTLTGATSATLGGRPLSGASSTLTCNAGFNISGAATVSCQANGQWSAPLPICISEDCPNIFDASGVANSTTFHGGSAYTFTCNEDLAVQATGAVFTAYNCAPGGQWASSFAACVATCPALGPFFDGSTSVVGVVSAPLNGRALANAIVYYTCNAGYMLLGAAASTCLPTGDWSSTPPTCSKPTTTLPPRTPPPPQYQLPLWWLWIILGTIGVAVGIWLGMKWSLRSAKKARAQRTADAATMP